MMVPWLVRCSSGGDEKRSDSGCILKMELMGFSDGWDVGWRERAG